MLELGFQFPLFDGLPVAGWTSSAMLAMLTSRFYVFFLVFVRISGLFLVGPILGQGAVPVQIRILLILTTSFLITPAIPSHLNLGFRELDLNGDNVLAREETPEILLAHATELNRSFGKPPSSPLTAAEWRYPLVAPASYLQWAVDALRELSFGLVLGLGLATIFSGLQMAGELIDQQTGIGLSGVFNPGFDMNAGVSGQALYLLGLTVFLTMPPLSGHLLVVSALLDTFRVIPVGEATITLSAIELLSDLVHQSFCLGVQIASPVLVAMALTALTMGFLSHTVPQINVLNLGFPIRAMINVFLLAVSLAGVAGLLIHLLPKVIERIAFQMIG